MHDITIIGLKFVGVWYFVHDMIGFISLGVAVYYMRRKAVGIVMMDGAPPPIGACWVLTHSLAGGRCDLSLNTHIFFYTLGSNNSAF